MLLAALVLPGCKDDSCTPTDPESCADGLVCEQVVIEGEDEEQHACFSPVTVTGQVYDLADDGAISGARVVALDANGAPAGRVDVSDEAGSYAVSVAVARDAEGVPLQADPITLRADAAGYQSFPGGIRAALPIDLGDAVEDEEGWSVQSTLTDIGLIALPEGHPTGEIHGMVEVPTDQIGVLVVAEQGGAGLSAVADIDGDYRIFNVPEGSWSVAGYSQGSLHETATVAVSSDEVAQDIALIGEATASVSGSVNIVNAPGDAETSVILVVASTFDTLTGRGDSPPVLRSANVSGEYTISGVPDGRYAVLGAFEDDGLVRDPDYEQGGTELQVIEVAGGDVSVDGFKITEALEIIRPGADGPETVDAQPVFEWVDDSGEKRYDILVFDSLGEIVWETSIDGTSGSDPSLTYDGDPLEPGMYYQFRVTSIDQGGVPISRTQDLDGVFLVE